MKNKNKNNEKCLICNYQEASPPEWKETCADCEDLLLCKCTLIPPNKYLINETIFYFCSELENK